MGEITNFLLVSVRKTEGQKPLGKPVRGWEGNIKTDLKEM
jgi:hypothetical protein